MNCKLRRATTDYRFSRDDEDTTAIEKRYRDEIDDGEVDGNKCSERQNLGDPCTGCVPHHRDESHRPHDTAQIQGTGKCLFDDGPEILPHGKKCVDARLVRKYCSVHEGEWCRGNEHKVYAYSRAVALSG